MPNVSRRSLAARLLEKLVHSETLSAEKISEELLATPEQIRRYAETDEEVPMPQQMLLAALLIGLGGTWAASGYQLRGQLEATMRFNERETTSRPPGPFAFDRYLKRGR